LLKKENQSLYTNKKIFLFTDNDQPIDDSNVQQKNILRNTRNNIEDSMITITPFFISTQTKPFDESVYKELMTLTNLNAPKNDDDIFNINDANDTLLFDGPNSQPIDVSYIKERILRRKEIKRKQFETSFIFSDDLVIGVKGYTFYSHEQPSRSKFLYESVDYRKNVYSRRRFIDEKTGYEFENTTKAFKFGINEDDYFEISPENLQKLSTFDPQRDTFLRLLGFKAEKLSLKPHYQSSPSNPFLIPDENSFEGSTRTLAALYKSLKKFNKCAVVFGKLRKGSQPSIYALQASSNPFPEGFFLIRLPFLDDIRQIPAGFEIYENPSEQLLRITKLILLNLKLKHGYSPSEFKNPSLQQHYRVLHDYLLQVEQTEDEDSTESRLKKDDTLKKIQQIRERVEQSQLDPDSKDRLFKYIQGWNKVYRQGQI
jgi:ATP-dependent DNA helicase 2 subunit 1